MVPRVKVPNGISRSSVMTAKELSRALNGLQNMGGGRIATPSPLQQQSINLTSGISYNILPWLDDDGDSVVPGSKNRQRVPLPLLQILTALADRLETRAERLSGPMVATAVYGLQVDIKIKHACTIAYICLYERECVYHDIVPETRQVKLTSLIITDRSTKHYWPVLLYS